MSVETGQGRAMEVHVSSYSCYRRLTSCQRCLSGLSPLPGCSSARSIILHASKARLSNAQAGWTRTDRGSCNTIGNPAEAPANTTEPIQHSWITAAGLTAPSTRSDWRTASHHQSPRLKLEISKNGRVPFGWRTHSLSRKQKDRP